MLVVILCLRLHVALVAPHAFTRPPQNKRKTTMKTIDGMKVIRAVTQAYEDLVIVGTEEQIVRHMISNPYHYFEVCKWFNTFQRDVQSKVLIAIDPDEAKSLVHNMRDDFKGTLKQLQMLQESFDGCATVRMVDVLYLPALEDEEAPKADVISFE